MSSPLVKAGVFAKLANGPEIVLRDLFHQAWQVLGRDSFLQSGCLLAIPPEDECGGRQGCLFDLLEIQGDAHAVHRHHALADQVLVSDFRTSLDRDRWQLNRVIFTACLPSLIHCSAVPRLL